MKVEDVAFDREKAKEGEGLQLTLFSIFFLLFKNKEKGWVCKETYGAVPDSGRLLGMGSAISRREC